MSMIIKKTVVVLLLTFLLSNCDSSQSDEKIDLNSDPNKVSDNVADSKKILDNAKNALKNVDAEFQWRDTHLILENADKAMNAGDFKLSIDLSNKVIQQTVLMTEQKQFANEYWQDLIPKSN